MEEKVGRLSETIRQMKDLGVRIPEGTEDALAQLNDPEYRIGIVGRFQVGKSRLINEAFLCGSEFLRTGEGVCTTAVNTEIAYGESAKLTVRHRGEETVREVVNPVAEDVHRATACTDETERLKLASVTESVCLTVPCERLRRFTVFDTVGIDDPKPELLRLTTYDLIPRLDAAVLVTGAKALSSGELDFLRNDVFDCGLGKAMVLVAYDPERDSLSAAGCADLRTAIQGQLEEIGRGQIPVKVVSFGEAAIEGVVTGAEAIYGEIAGFVREVTFENRVSKLAVGLRKVLTEHVAELTFRLSLVGKSEAEIREVQAGILRSSAELRAMRDEFESHLDAMMRMIRQETIIQFRADCNDIAEGFMRGFDGCGGLAEAQKRLNKVPEIVQPRVECAALKRFEAIRERIAGELPKLNALLESFCRDCNLPTVGFRPGIELDGGVCESLNATAVTIADYLISMFLLPGGLFMSWCIRFFAGSIPWVKEIVPSALVRGHLVRVVRQSLSEKMEEVVDDFRDETGNVLRKLRTEILKAVNGEIDRRLHEAMSATAACGAGTGAEDAERIRRDIDACARLVTDL